MNWYLRNCKIASITFSPSGARKISQPMDMESLGNDIMRFADRAGITNIMVEPDGGYEWGPTGIMNFYLLTTDGDRNPLPANQRASGQDVINLVNQYIADKAGTFEMEVMQVDTSQSRPDTRVVRVNVSKNETQDYSEVPEVNIANDNATALIELLNSVGLALSPHSGSFSADDYKRVRPVISDTLRSMFSRGHEEEKEEGKPAYIEFGLSPDMIEGYLQRLDQIVAWMEQQQIPQRVISYG
tara:strand:+ start:3725 stop:4450 length:726 start_codon:yes stop_codon:yes gene_type:complete